MTVSIPLTEVGGHVTINRIPDRCPICHHDIAPTSKYVRSSKGTFYGANLEILLLCTNTKCDELFIAYYGMVNNVLHLKDTRPVELSVQSLAESVKALSPKFCEIYQEADKAEGYGLSQICGVGYRKALEFLLKDYAIKIEPKDQDDIRKTPLGNCIQKYVKDEKVKAVAKRAAWLGNDETHYERIWIKKDLTDLKLLIDLTIHWIEMEDLTNKALESMPEKK